MRNASQGIANFVAQCSKRFAPNAPVQKTIPPPPGGRGPIRAAAVDPVVARLF
jgi:hypothetical protein